MEDGRDYAAFEYTPWGRAGHATGGNPRAALLAGIRTDRVTVQCFVGAGLYPAFGAGGLPCSN